MKPFRRLAVLTLSVGLFTPLATALAIPSAHAASTDARVAACKQQKELVVSECLALVDLDSATGFASATSVQAGGFTFATPCGTSWSASLIQCYDKHVVGILLGSLGLNGSIPGSIGKFTKLVQLLLPYNNLTGPIPTSVGKLTNLVQLSFQHNNLTGPIPWSMGHLERLTSIELNDNNLTGTIPAHLGDLTELRTLSVSNNSMAGRLPTALTHLAHVNICINGTRLTTQGWTAKQLAWFTAHNVVCATLVSPEIA